MVFTIAAILIAGVQLAQPQNTAAPRPLVQLMKDLDVAIPHAHLRDTQKLQVQSDREALETAREAKEQGNPVNRKQVMSAVRNLHEIVESGAFPLEDKQTLQADFEVLRKQ